QASRGVRVTSSERVVGGGAESVEIRTMVEADATEGFGSDAGGCSRDHGGVTEARQCAEVDELRLALARESDVAGAHVAVDEPPAVEERERRRDVPEIGAHLPPPERAPRPQVDAVVELHRVERAALVDAIVVDLDDPRVTQRNQRLVFALEQRSDRGRTVLEA